MRVVANAGIVDTIHRAERFSDDEWHKDIETNLHGAFYLAQAAFDALAASGDGRVVLISSAGAETGIPGQVAAGRRRVGADAALSAADSDAPGTYTLHPKQRDRVSGPSRS